MGNIHQLEDQVINQIAAGEVVERPAHLLKELLENSIDADATKIVVEIRQNGRSVKVTDNGNGLDSEDLKKCLNRHTTSKIKNAQDLWALKTFGFRGEALSSISSVSKFAMRSQPRTQARALQVTSDFGTQSEPYEAATLEGTEVEVRDLFENTPARLKFLKAPAAEISQMKQVLKSVALSHPELEIKVLIDGELEFFWGPCSSRTERVAQVLGFKELRHVTFQDDVATLEIVFSEPKWAAKTSKNIWLFAQNRWIQDRSLQQAVLEGFRTFLMQGEFPQCVVWIDVDPAQIDVNVHPTKSVVKFQDPQSLFRRIYHVIHQNLNQPKQMTMTTVQPTVFEVRTAPPIQVQWPVEKTQLKKVDFNVVSKPLEVFRPQDSVEPVCETGFWSGLQVIGQVHMTYILAQNQKSVYLIDQHAAHERIAFEKLWAGWRQGKIEVQQLLMPITVDLDPETVGPVCELKEEFQRLGLSFEQSGPQSVAVFALPSIVKDHAVPGVFLKTAAKIKEQSVSFEFEKILSDLFATMACHSVIRAGHAMSVEEMKNLLAEMDCFPGSSYCPHGRPVAIDWGFDFIEKEFGRKL